MSNMTQNHCRKLSVFNRAVLFSCELNDVIEPLYEYLKEHNIRCELAYYPREKIPNHISSDPYHIYGIEYFNDFEFFFVLYVHKRDFKKAIILKNLYDLEK